MAEPKPSRDPEAASLKTPGSIALIAVAACAVVALVAGGARLVQPAIPLEAGASWALRVVGALIVAGGVAALLSRREDLAPRTAGGADPSWVGLTTAAATMTALALLSLMAHPLAPRPSGDGVPYMERPPDVAGSDTVPALPPPPQFGLGFAFAGEDQLQEPDSSGAASIEGTSNDTRQRVAVMVRRLALLLLAAAVGWFLARWLRQFGSHRSGVPVTRDKAEEGLETSLLAFDLDGGDPREQITAAYHRLLAVLDRAEAPRESYEAPHEHLDRVLGPLGIPPAPLHRLAGLYVRAQFSEMPVTEEHRDDAVQALNESLGALCSLATEALEQPRRRSPIGSRT